MKEKELTETALRMLAEYNYDLALAVARAAHLVGIADRIIQLGMVRSVR